MREALPTDLLLRLMNATPEQFAAVERELGCGGSEKADGKSEIGVGEDVARSAFALLQKLELDAPLKAPSVLTVFRLYCVDALSADRVARKCRCAKGTVMSRLRFIEQRTGMKPEQFRAVSGQFARMEKQFSDSRAASVYRRGLANEEDQEG